MLVVLYRLMYLVIPVKYLGFCVITDNFSPIPVSRTIPGSLPSHLRDIPNPENRSGRSRDKALEIDGSDLRLVEGVSRDSMTSSCLNSLVAYLQTVC